MTNVKIVTDSSCTMEKSLRDELNIHMMPLSIMVDGVVYPMMIICQAKNLWT